MTYVIVGNGVASVGAIEGIRKVDREGRILVISEEAVPSYGRPLISYYLAGKVALENMSLRPEEYYGKHNVEQMLNTRIVGLDPALKTLTTERGEAISYDEVLLATGGTPFMPPIEGLEGSGVFSFTTLEHAEQLIALSRRVRRVVVIGGGLIGLKAAEGLFDNGLSVSIVELSSRVLSAAFDDVAGGLVSRQLERKGIRIHCGNTAEAVLRDEQGNVTGVRLTSGQELACEAVVVAIGVVPSLTPAKEGGLKTKRGIVVDDYMRTSTEHVYAAGDVAEAYDMITDDQRVVPIWPNAYSQGYHAGMNMAGGDTPHPGGLAMNSIAFYGLATASLGQVNPQPEDGCEVFTFVDE